MANNNIYIRNLDGADIYNNQFRGLDLEGKNNYTGMLCHSLELIKLRKLGLKVRENEITEKLTSDDIINVKFKKNVKNATEMLLKLELKITNTEKTIKELKEKEIKDEKKNNKNIKRIEKKKELLIRIKKQKENYENNEEVYEEIKFFDIREKLYNDGFKIGKTEYVVLGRSGSKSRTGQCLFIKKTLLKDILNWCRMGLKMPKDTEIDYVAMLVYETLVGSSIEDTIEIDVDSILIVNDVDSIWQDVANSIESIKKINKVTYEEYNGLECIEKECTIKNSLFDGENLLDSELFIKADRENKGFVLLRNHFFKSASTHTNLTEFLQDNCPTGVNFEDWKIKNMFEQEIFAKDIRMVCTPTSLKLLKFSYKDEKEINLNMTKLELWEHWKKTVKEDGNIFGICKAEKISKRGYSEDGKILQQTSYQMVNSMPFTKEEIEEISQIEKDFIMELKNNDDAFIEYVKTTISTINSHEMMVELCNTNKDFIRTKMFKDFRAKTITNYVANVKKSKLKQIGDYCILLGNPMEFLYHAIGRLNYADAKNVHIEGVEQPLVGNEIYTTLFTDGEEVVCFRNPHTSPSNVLVAKNKVVDDIYTYFNLTPNIVCVNSINFEIQDILSSGDFDSDSIVIYNNKTMVKVGKRCKDYKVCINNVSSKPQQYIVNSQNMYEIDKSLADSQRYIGQVVNSGQRIMSKYYDLLNSNGNEDELEELLDKINIATVLSTICIDMAKKSFKLDMQDAINDLLEGIDKIQPMLFKQLKKKKKNKIKRASNQTKTIRYRSYKCPSDYLISTMSMLPQAESKGKDILFNSLLIDNLASKGDRKQEDAIIDKTKDMVKEFNFTNLINKGTTDEEEDQKYNELEDIIKNGEKSISRLAIKSDTMYSILYHIGLNKRKDIQRKLMNVLYKTNRELFLENFIKKVEK